MNDVSAAAAPFTQREILVNSLYEAAELEHNLMCTYLYAAASLKSGEGEGLEAAQAAAVKRWRQVLQGVAIEEMGHLAPFGTSPQRSVQVRASVARTFPWIRATCRPASR